MSKRKYTQKKRVENQIETRQQIVDATVYLHETVGVRDTTISAIAKQAGVERLTVYRHFADETEILNACTSHYLLQNPLPDPNHWVAIDEPEACLRVALGEIYTYHRQTEAMMLKTYQDLESVPALQEVLIPFFEYWDNIRDRLAEKYGKSIEPHSLLRAVLGHAIHFLTWHSLVQLQGLKDDEAIEVMVIMIQEIANKNN